MPSSASSSASSSSSQNPARQLKLNSDLLDLIMRRQTPEVRQEYAQLNQDVDTARY
ncbi:hypothetical protein HK102_003061, partial [Quaeritorhiza haematococci]